MAKNTLSEIERFCLAGYSVTKDVDMAYKLSRRGKEMTGRKDMQHKMALRWARSPLAKAYLEELSQVGLARVKAEGSPNRSKSDIVTELNNLASKTADPKQRAEILLKLADFERMKEEKPTNMEAESPIRYYLPLKYPRFCEECVIWQKKHSKHGQEGSKRIDNR